MAKISITEIVNGLGGMENIVSATHCATRLRVTLKDKAKADQKPLKAIDGVLGVVDGATQTQVQFIENLSNILVYQKKQQSMRI